MATRSGTFVSAGGTAVGGTESTVRRKTRSQGSHSRDEGLWAAGGSRGSGTEAG